jgi:hypothetical protein
MFIYCDSEPPAKADIQVEVSFPTRPGALMNLHLRARSVLVRLESAASRDDLRGFAILNRSYKLHNGLTDINDADLGIEIN